MKKESSKKESTDIAQEVTPKWLKTIQLNSWEAELLISALVLYALFQIPEFLNEFSLSTFARGSSMHNLINLMVDAVGMLSFGYILHIMVRGTWVASVGLSYVFPKGVKPEELKFKGKFKEEVTRHGSLIRMVLNLEQLSSIIYGVSFIFFGTLVGFGVFLFSFIFFFEWAQPIVNRDFALMGIFGILVLFYFFLSLIVFFDFLTNGLLRRKNWSADWFYYVAKIFRIFTLSFLYRRSLLVLISNVHGWKKYLIPFIILGVLGGYKWIDNSQRDNRVSRYYQKAAAGEYNKANYESLRSNSDHLSATIQSDIVSENVLRVFLKDLGTFGGIYIHEGNRLKNSQWDDLSSDSVSIYFNHRLDLKIDEYLLPELSWHITQHPVTLDFGFSTFVDIDSLVRGAHDLRIEIDTVGMTQSAKNVLQRESYSTQQIGNIYFFYDKK